jgi:hypothetical protein
MNDMNFPNYYVCKECSRVTRTYPIGCDRVMCQVKKDMINDICWSLIWIAAVCGALYYIFIPV